MIQILRTFIHAHKFDRAAYRTVHQKNEYTHYFKKNS